MLMTDRMHLAITEVGWAFDGRFRKGSGNRQIPQVTHLMASALLVDYYFTDEAGKEDITIATLHHDTLEDVPERYPPERIAQVFGSRVLHLVQGVTEPK